MIDYEIETTDTGYDITLPLTKISEASTLLFNQVRLLLDTYTGEFLYDNTQGIDYDSFLGDNTDLTTLRSKYYSKIKNLEYFGSMTDFKVDVTNRKLEISFTVTSSDGDSEDFEQEL